MAYKIKFGGDDIDLLDVYLRALAEDQTGGSQWYVEIVTHEGDDIAGYVTRFEVGPRRVTIAEGELEDGNVVPTGRTLNVRTEDIYVLEVP